MEYFKQIVDILKKRSWKVYVLLVSVFLLFFIVAYFSGSYVLTNDPKMAEDFINQIKNTDVIQTFYELISKGDYPQIVFLIFVHNSQIAILNYVLGISFLLPLLTQASNGVVIGFLFSFSPKLFSNFVDTAGFFVILLLEIGATTLTAVEGMYLTYSLIRPKKMWKTDSRLKSAKMTFLEQSVKILLLSFAILFLSAIIETALIYYQWVRNFTSPIIGV